jgi:hypothetical protein
MTKGSRSSAAPQMRIAETCDGAMPPSIAMRPTMPLHENITHATATRM